MAACAKRGAAVEARGHLLPTRPVHAWPCDPDTRALPQEFVELLTLKPDERVLDVGCGIGGGDFYMASKYGAFVHGIDLSVNMVTTALERAFAAKDGHKVIPSGHSFCAVLCLY